MPGFYRYNGCVEAACERPKSSVMRPYPRYSRRHTAKGNGISINDRR